MKSIKNNLFNHKQRILVVLCIFVLVSCAQENHQKDDLKKFIEKVKISPVPQKKASQLKYTLPNPIFYQSATYKPFEIGSGKKNEMLFQPSPGNYLDAIKFIGTITIDNKNFAYLMMPDNKIYTVKEGDIIGNNYAKIAKINADQISILELQTGRAAPSSRIITLKLKD